jgi:hypothetical protein
MIFKAKYTLNYLINNKPKTMEVIVSIDKIEPATYIKGMSLFCGSVLVDGIKKEKYDLKTSVNALFSAEKIGQQEKEELIKKIESEGKTFKLKNEKLDKLK